MAALEPAFTIVDCVLLHSASAEFLSALDSLCGRPLFMFAVRASMAATKGPIWVRVPANDQDLFRGRAAAEPRLRFLDDTELNAELRGAATASALVICGYLPLDAPDALSRALIGEPSDNETT